MVTGEPMFSIKIHNILQIPLGFIGWDHPIQSSRTIRSYTVIVPTNGLRRMSGYCLSTSTTGRLLRGHYQLWSPYYYGWIYFPLAITASNQQVWPQIKLLPFLFNGSGTDSMSGWLWPVESDAPARFVTICSQLRLLLCMSIATASVS